MRNMLITFRQSSKLNCARYIVLSILNYVIKQKTVPWQTLRQHVETENLQLCKLSSTKAKKNVYKSIQNRFLICPIHRQSQLNIGWTEEHCARLDEIAAEHHSHIATAAERSRRVITWVLVLNSSGPNGPMNQREYYEEAKETCQRPYQECGQAHHKLHPREQLRSRRPEDRLEVVRHPANTKLFFPRMATVCMVAGMVTNI